MFFVNFWKNYQRIQIWTKRSFPPPIFFIHHFKRDFVPRVWNTDVWYCTRFSTCHIAPRHITIIITTLSCDRAIDRSIDTSSIFDWGCVMATTHLQRIEKGTRLLHHVDALYGRLGGGCGARCRIDRGRTAPLTGARRARRRGRREALHRDVSPFRGRKLLAQIVQVFGVAEVEVGLGQRPAPRQVAGVRFIAGHWRPMMVVFSQRFRIRFHVTHIVGCGGHGKKKEKKINFKPRTVITVLLRLSSTILYVITIVIVGWKRLRPNTYFKQSKGWMGDKKCQVTFFCFFFF